MVPLALPKVLRKDLKWMEGDTDKFYQLLIM